MRVHDDEQLPGSDPDARPSLLTRRRLLVGAAATAGAAGAHAATPWAASLGARTPRLVTLELGILRAGVVREVSGQSFDLAGVQWRGDPRAAVMIRAGTGGGRWSRWVDASDRRHAPSESEDPRPRAGTVGEPVWTGRADRLQVHAQASLSDVRLHLIDGGGSPSPALAAALPLAQPVLAAGPGQPPIIARSAWGPGLRPRGPILYGEIHLGIVHHTEGANDYASSEVAATLRSIYAFHRFVRGWKDIGYNFLIDRFGRIWEGRAGGIDEPVVGAQSGGYNAVSTGVAILGSYSAQAISPAAQRALTHLLAWKLSLHGVPAIGHASVQVSPFEQGTSRHAAGAVVSLPRIAGHRDVDYTDCPGDALYQELGAVRHRTASLADRPLELRLEPPTRPATAPGPALVSGRAAFLDGTPLGGATVLVQARGNPLSSLRESTVTQAVTDPSGGFTAQVPVSYAVSLRALHPAEPAAPAAVSAPLHLDVAPLVTLQVAQADPPPGTPAQLSGTVHPAKAQVLLRMSAVAANGTTTRLRELTLAGSSGSFAATVALPAPGTYRFEAATASDARNVAGASAPVDVTAT